MGKKTQGSFISSLKQMDQFGAPVMVNVEGDSSIPSVGGSLISILYLLVMLIYTIQQFNIWYFRLAPQVQELIINDYFSSSEKIQLDNFMIAFGAFDVMTNEPKDNPEYVSWIARTRNVKTGQFQDSVLGIRKCTQDDYNKFYPANQARAQAIDMYKKKNGFYCLSQTEELQLIGDLNDVDSQSFFVALVPCSEANRTNVQCDKNQEQTAAYLDRSQQVFIYNTQRFDQNYFNASKIVYETDLHKQGFSGQESSFQQTAVTQHKIFDYGRIAYKGTEIYNQTRLMFGGVQHLISNSLQDIKNILLSQAVIYHLNFVSLLNQIRYVQPSPFSDWPNSYFYVANRFYLDKNLYTLSRKTQDAFDSLANVGGVQSLLQPLCQLIIGGLASFNAKHLYVSQLFAIQPSLQNDVNKVMPGGPKKRQTLAQTFVGDLKQRKFISTWIFYTQSIWDFVCCLQQQERVQKRLLRNKMQRASDQIDKEMDLLAIIRALRSHTIQIQTLMTLNQIKLSERISLEVLADVDGSSSDNQQSKTNFPRPKKWFEPIDHLIDESEVETCMASLNVIDQSLVRQIKVKEQARSLRHGKFKSQNGQDQSSQPIAWQVQDNNDYMAGQVRKNSKNLPINLRGIELTQEQLTSTSILNTDLNDSYLQPQNLQKNIKVTSRRRSTYKKPQIETPSAASEDQNAYQLRFSYNQANLDNDINDLFNDK